MDAELKAHRADRDSAKRSVADANALREKEAGAYAASSAELNSNIGAIGKTWPLPGALVGIQAKQITQFDSWYVYINESKRKEL